ncbi:MAG TPA: PLP-dependent aspartate aminotransferase family protein [Planctomycetota bacterium]|nr:PLP-dependent aspartate aminotransferase family protein [Planctomycetota bacterium]
MRLDTILIHHAQEADPATGALATPIAQTSTFVQESPGVHKGYDYSRTNNPTRETLERVLAALEGVERCAVFSSGLAAENAILQALVRPGDAVITTPDLYGGTYRLLNAVFGPLGVSHRQVDLNDADALGDALATLPARLVWVESPTNPRLQVYDIARICDAARRFGVPVVVDNTFATPVNQRPFELGADLVVHSVTKYLAGHSDLVQGAVLAREERLFAPVKLLQNATGAVPSPFDCWLTLRGLKTLPLRVERHNRSALELARRLEGHAAVARVHYPGLPSHPGHGIARRQSCGGFGGVVSIELLATEAETRRFVSTRRYFKLAESLGGVKSLVCHPASMTHASIPSEERRRLGLPDTLVRLSVGLEDVRDLAEDLLEGLDGVTRARGAARAQGAAERQQARP